MRLIDAEEAELLLNGWDWQNVYFPVQFKVLILDACPSFGQGYHGQWEDEIETSPISNTPTKTGRYVCSQCTFTSTVRYDYCPGCGARMCEERKEQK